LITLSDFTKACCSSFNVHNDFYTVIFLKQLNSPF